ncbi:MAG: hypothetical protein ACKPKO_10320, partial [Candidatus Fonsibacter sp.]
DTNPNLYSTPPQQMECVVGRGAQFHKQKVRRQRRGESGRYVGHDQPIGYTEEVEGDEDEDKQANTQRGREAAP